ncbi:ATP-dependent DNA helicase [Haloferula sp.]|uniref:ATP-dependent DNA helicase n=1 Tax=Haloferula sp. TaxID=2497595 RepID=UPI00329AD259
MSALEPEDEFIRKDLGQSFDQIAGALADWLKGQLFRLKGKNWWKSHVCSLLSEEQQGRVADGEWNDIRDLDLYALLGVLISNFPFLKCQGALKKEHRDLILGMRVARNRCVGHRPVRGVSRQELLIHIDAMKSFCPVIGASKALREGIDSLAKRVREYEATALREIPAKTPPAPSVEAGDQRSLLDFFGDEELTPSQANAVEGLQAFLDDPDEKCFILRGYAGTGKTFLIGGLIRYLKSRHRMAQMMAPTGRAAHVLRDRHQMEASTIHRHIYSLTSLKEYREMDHSGDLTFKFYFDRKNNDIEHDTVFIVDEASMIGDVHSESEFMHFGSGRLLSDLIRYINFDKNDYRKKLILVGDDAQLPPVGMNSSPALDTDYLKKKCLIPSKSIELTDVVRQLDSSPILDNATRMRELLKSGKFPAFEFKVDGSSITETTPEMFVTAFVDAWHDSPSQSGVIVAYTNASARTYNQAVRARLFSGKDSLIQGDRVIVVKNNYNYKRTLLNGQMGFVVNASPDLEVRKVPLNVGVDSGGQRKTEIIELKFRDATLRFDDDRGGTFEVECKIFEDCMHNNEAGVPSEISKALYVDFKTRHPGLTPKSPEFKEQLKADPYFNAVMLKFGYAITCHKAQGGEWHTVFIDFSGKNKLNADGLRWSYTALTRAEAAIVATNALHHHILKPKKPATRPLSETATASLPESDSGSLPKGGQPEATDSPAEAIRRLVETVLPSDWEVSTARTLPYQERFTLAAGEETVTISVYHNSKEKISKVQISPTPGKPDLDEIALKAFGSLKGSSLSLENKENKEHQEVGEGQLAFAESLRSELEATKILVVSLESKSEYHLMARLRAGGQEGCVNYYFDKHGSFTRFMPQSSCPPGIIDQLNELHG